MTDIAALAGFVASRPPGERHDGLFWAACRAAEAGLDPAPLVTAAEQAGVSHADAERAVGDAARTIAQQEGSVEAAGEPRTRENLRRT